MKKILFIPMILLLLTLVACSFDPSAFLPGTVAPQTAENIPATTTSTVPSHVFSGEWSYTGTAHYHACTEEDCEEKADLAPHAFGAWEHDPENALISGRVCTVCGYREEKEDTTSLKITAPKATTEAYAVSRVIRNYLNAHGDDVQITDYLDGYTPDGIVPITVSFSCSLSGVSGYTLTYATKEDFSDGVTVSLGTAKKSADLYNLFVGTTYYVRLCAEAGGLSYTVTSSFRTAGLCPRVIRVPGLVNVRDIGGVSAQNEKTVRQGLLFRGPRMDGGSSDPSSLLSSAGENILAEELGIVTDLDLRAPEEVAITKSPIPGARFLLCPTVQYGAVFTEAGKQKIRAAFAVLADPDNYPVYVHCSAGADRTGTLCFLLGALLGVDEETLIKDYEFTSFAADGTYGTVRDSHTDVWDNGGGFTPFVNKLKNDYAGNTLAEKIESYLLSIGVTQTEIASIRSILLTD